MAFRHKKRLTYTAIVLKSGYCSNGILEGKDGLMKKVCILATIVAVLLSLAGCIESTTLVRVKKDGSGEVEETLLMRTDVMQMIMGMSEEMGGETGELELVDREQLEKQAGQMGEGVTLKSVEKIATESHMGYQAVFSFRDINTLEVNQNPDENVPDTGSPGEEPPNKEIITFHFEKARGKKPALLVINLPEEQMEASAEEPDEMVAEQNEDMTNMLREIFRDMKINVSLEVDGEIVETNATHKEGSKITLMAIDFEKVIQNEQVFQELAVANPDSLEKTKELLKDVPGIKVELQNRIELQFK